MKRIVAVLDPTLRAEVVRCTPLHYEDGASPALDRAGHVRAASSIASLGDRLIIVQDDANFLAEMDLASGTIRSVTLAAGEGGLRQFDDRRGNKHLKLDLEAVVVVPEDNRMVLLAFGSGSSRLREGIVVVAGESIQLRQCPALYAALRSSTNFAGSELNIEGAIYTDGCIRLFNRGNGKQGEGVGPVNATCDLEWASLRRYLANPSAEAFPPLERITQYDLGLLDGHRLSFTDAAVTDDAVLYSAVAELSPDAIRDGPVIGSVIGLIRDAEVRWTELRTVDGGRFDGKVEGIAADHDAGFVHVVVDRDDPEKVSELCRVRLSGTWPRL